MSVSIPGKSYKATGITLKSSPMGESDRLLTILTKEHGVVRVVTPGCRKPKSSLRAISSAFVMGELLIIKGRNLDKLVQADCRGSFPALSRDLGKLTAAQYLAELVLNQALGEHPQEELFGSFQHHLTQLSQRAPHQTLPYLVYSIFTILVSAGVAPQLQRCGVSRQLLVPDLSDPSYQVDFDIAAGQASQVFQPVAEPLPHQNRAIAPAPTVADRPGRYRMAPASLLLRPIPLTALQLWVLQQLAQLAGAMAGSPDRAIASPHPGNDSLAPQGLSLDDLLDAHLLNLEYLTQISSPPPSSERTLPQLASPLSHNRGTNYDNFLDEIFPINTNLWLALELLLRQYCHYHFDQPIQSAALIETCFPETID
ncbi:MAG: DNA repair protein RecO [Leptolyngbyaceae bacterium]|nr:DNA repair protein RecO [Leptolyngbyaceae bacterium]